MFFVRHGETSGRRLVCGTALGPLMIGSGVVFGTALGQRRPDHPCHPAIRQGRGCILRFTLITIRRATSWSPCDATRHAPHPDHPAKRQGMTFGARLHKTQVPQDVGDALSLLSLALQHEMLTGLQARSHAIAESHLLEQNMLARGVALQAGR